MQGVGLLPVVLRQYCLWSISYTDQHSSFNLGPNPNPYPISWAAQKKCITATDSTEQLMVPCRQPTKTLISPEQLPPEQMSEHRTTSWAPMMRLNVSLTVSVFPVSIECLYFTWWMPSFHMTYRCPDGIYQGSQWDEQSIWLRKRLHLWVTPSLLIVLQQSQTSIKKKNPFLPSFVTKTVAIRTQNNDYSLLSLHSHVCISIINVDTWNLMKGYVIKIYLWLLGSVLKKAVTDSSLLQLNMSLISISKPIKEEYGFVTSWLTEGLETDQDWS